MMYIYSIIIKSLSDTIFFYILEKTKPDILTDKKNNLKPYHSLWFIRFINLFIFYLLYHFLYLKLGQFKMAVFKIIFSIIIHTIYFYLLQKYKPAIVLDKNKNFKPINALWIMNLIGLMYYCILFKFKIPDDKILVKFITTKAYRHSL